jgi:hypothetical protein
MPRIAFARPLLLTAALLALPATLRGDATMTFYGSTVGERTIHRPRDLDELSNVGTAVRYSSQKFMIDADATCTITGVQEGASYDGHLALYDNHFFTGDTLAHLIAVNDNRLPAVPGQSQIADIHLSAGVHYELVTSGFDNDDAGTFSNQIVCGQPATRIVAGNGPFALDGSEVELLGGAFAVSVDWRDFTDTTGSGRVLPLGSTDSALFWFFRPPNWELLVKVIDGCDYNGFYWVYYAATTNVEFTLSVDFAFDEDGARTYFNPLGTSLRTAVTDSEAFPCLIVMRPEPAAGPRRR